MTDPMFDAPALCPTMYAKIGRVATEWAWVEMLLGEMLAHFCRADHGSMYVVTQNVSSATITDWLRTLTQIHVKDVASAEVILNLLSEVDTARGERNVIVHGAWRGHDTPGFGWVATFRWERQEVSRQELWSAADLDAVIENLELVQRMLGNLGLRMGFLKTSGTTP